MGVIDLDARVKKLEQDGTGGAVIDQLEAAVTALEGDVEDLQEGQIYSETEHVVGKWINGKPVYEKQIVYLVESTAVSGKLDVPHGVSDMETVVGLSGVINHSTVTPYGESFPSKDSTMGRVTVKASNIEVNISGGWTDYIFNINLRYTKSTDTAPTT